MSFEGLKVGDLARRTGLTVRALHHYDEVGLLKPSLRTESGHRLYTSDFLRTIEEMIMLEDYYTAEQLEYLKKRSDQVGEERMKQVPGEWAQLIAQVRAEMEKGTDPLSPEVLALARRWQGLLNEFTGGDPGIERSVGHLWKQQGDNLVNRYGAEYDSRGLSEYIGQAIAAVKGGN